MVSERFLKIIMERRQGRPWVQGAPGELGSSGQEQGFQAM
jgi:hypothetical protein